MKPMNHNPLSSLLVMSMCVALPAGLVAQDQPASAGTTRVNEVNTATQRQAASSPVEFAKDAIKSGEKEIKLSKLALKKTQDEEVRSFAKMMVDHHTALNRDLEAIADKEGFPKYSTHTRSSGVQWTWEMEREEARKRISAGVPGGSHQPGASQFPSDKQGRDRAYGTDVFAHPQGSRLAANSRDWEGRQDAEGRSMENREINGRDRTPDSDNRQYVRDAQSADNTRTDRSAAPARGDRKQGETYHRSAETDKGTDKEKDFDGLSGAEFDRAYLSEMVKGHTKSVAKYESASRTLANPKLAAFADSALPQLKEHKQQAEELARKKGVELTDNNVTAR